MKEKVIYWVSGSQTLYGETVLKRVEEHSKEIAQFLNEKMPVQIKYLTTCKSSEEVIKAVQTVNGEEECIGMIVWCHTFSPAKAWINGLKLLYKPLCHFATQYHEKIPYSTIDMNFMNENQSAHGDRELSYILSRMSIPHKVIVGHFESEGAVKELASWCKVVAGYDFSRALKVCRFSDNMRSVACTEGDKIEAHIKFGWQVDYFPIGDLVELIRLISERDVDEKMQEYSQKYHMNTDKIDAVREQAKYELAIEKFARQRGNYQAIVDHFGALHGLEQLPGLAIQNLQAKGYGFGPEGDWKISALGAILCYMSGNVETGLMEDYTYDFAEETCLGAHMLEVSPLFANEKPKIEVHPLAIGGKSDPARLVFEGIHGKDAIVVCMVDMGSGMRLLVQKVHLVKSPKKMPNLPVGSLIWRYEPNFQEGVSAWLYAGGAHHTVLTTQVTAEQMEELANLWGIECIVIDENTKLEQLRREL